MELMDIVLILLSYLLGCFNTGFYYTRYFYKQDIRAVGTNVTGAMNVSRVAGKKGFVITFLGDALKGAFVVVLCRLLKLSDITILLSILLVIMGHIFPFQLKFRGGKGLSTLIPFIRRYTVTSLFALMLLPLELFIADYPWKMIGFILLYVILLIFACRDNLKDYVRTRAYEGNVRGKVQGEVQEKKKLKKK